MHYVQGKPDRIKQKENPKTIENRRISTEITIKQIIQKHLYYVK
jgi:hypothetical protein